MQALVDGIKGDLNISFTGLNNNVVLSFTGLTNKIDMSFKSLYTNFQSSFLGLTNNLNVNFGKEEKQLSSIDGKEEESNRIGRAANRLALLGLTLEAMSIAATAAASSPFTAVVAVGLGITAAALVAGAGGYAAGGYPTMGQMFIAREAGPELVGTIGSNSAVVNNDQIVESVSAGVYDAVVAALSRGGAGRGGDVVVQVDSREIARAAMNGSKRLGYAVAG